MQMGGKLHPLIVLSISPTLANLLVMLSQSISEDARGAKFLICWTLEVSALNVHTAHIRTKTVLKTT